MFLSQKKQGFSSVKKIRLQKIVKNTILGYKKTEFDSFFVIGRLFQVPKKGKFHRKNKRKRPALRESVKKGKICWTDA